MIKELPPPSPPQQTPGDAILPVSQQILEDTALPPVLQPMLEDVARPDFNDGTTTFSHPASMTRMFNWIVAGDQSISKVETSEFRALLLLMRKQLQDKDILNRPNRKEIQDSIIKAWKGAIEASGCEMRKSLGRISYTTALWKDHNSISWFVVTAHWIARNRDGMLQLMEGLPSFHRFHGQRKDPQIATAFLTVVDRDEQAHKTGHITAHASFLPDLAELLQERGIEFDPHDRHIYCFPRSINRAADAALRKLCTPTNSIKTVDPVAPDADASTATKFAQALQHLPISCAQAIVHGCCKSVERQKMLARLIVEGNANGFFGPRDDPIYVPEVQLHRNYGSHWTSIYLMIGDLRMLRPVIDVFLAHPFNRELARYAMTDGEWDALEDIEELLAIPYGSQKKFTRHRIPVIADSIPEVDRLKARWVRLAERKPYLAPFVEAGLVKVRKAAHRMQRSRAHVLALLLNPTVKMSQIRAVWNPSHLERAETWVTEELQKYRHRSPRIHLDSLSDERSAPSALAENQLVGSDEATEEPDLSTQTVEEEQRAYLGARHAPRRTNTLEFWDLNRYTYPTFFKMAMDILPAQASAVPSKRIFSSLSETASTRRDRIDVELMAAVQTLKYMLRKKRLDLDSGCCTDGRDLDGKEHKMILDDALELMNSVLDSS